ncbi:MAG: NADH-quinone oxidoreductase subunit NuoN [Burkholderiaceae bacterium]
MTFLNWAALTPEIFLLLAALVIVLVDLFIDDEQRRYTHWMSQSALAITALLHYQQFDAGLTLYALGNLVVTDPMGRLLGVLATLALMASLAYAQPYIASRALHKGEFYVLALLSLLGIHVMLSANDFLVIYLGLEIMSLSLYALVALRRDDAMATEAAMKYFVLGALASGFLLYGLSMMYGATGTLEIPKVFEVINQGRVNSQVLVFGVVFIVAGLGFKLGVAPFHMWVPDVYQGAPTAVTLLIASAPKLAAFAITIRLLVEGLLKVAVDWQQMLLFMAVVSLVVGNLAAIAQTNLKRMLAYSAIAQLGFMLLALGSGVMGGDTASAGNAYSSAMFYMVTYVLTTLGTFGLVMLLSRDGFESEQIADLAGLGRRRPWMAGVMAIFMFSLAGVPPTMGFYAKLAVLQTLVTTGLTAYIVLAVVAVLLSLVAAFYYLRVVKVMFFDEPNQPLLEQPLGSVGVLLVANGAAVLVFGLLPGGLMALCRDAVVRALAT